MIAALHLSLRGLWREWKSGELRVIELALAIAVAAVTAVGFFTDRVEHAMSHQAAELLAADLVVTSPDPIRGEITAQAGRLGLRQARTVAFPSVVLQGEQAALTEVKAVSPGYPLRGRLRVTVSPYGTEAEVVDIPEPGSVWVEAGLLSRLQLSIGDSLQLGERQFIVTKILSYEPDRGSALFQLAPRVLMNEADLGATGLVTPASRVVHHLLVAGHEARVAEFQTWLEHHLRLGERVLNVEAGRPELQTALERARQFLGLAALVAVLLGGSAIALAARQYAARQLDACAIMRCLGASAGLLLRMTLLRLGWLALLAGAVGCALGYLAQQVLSRMLAQWFVSALPVPSLLPVITGLVTGLVILLGFALPPLLRLRRVAPLRVLRRDQGVAPPAAWAVVLLAFVAMVSLMLWQTAEPRLAAWIIGGSVATLVVLVTVAAGLIGGLRRLGRGSGVVWRLGLAGIGRRGWSSTVQLSAIGLGIMALLLLALVRADLLQAWQRTLPSDAPNQFLINVQPDQVAALSALFREHGRPVPVLHPMVRGRLVAVNGQSMRAEDLADERAQRLVEREFNLSWGARLQDDNKIVAGRWWMEGPAAEQMFSVEQGLARTLGLKLGDRLRFQVAGQVLEARIANLRSVQWDSFNVNFFVIANPGVLEDYPATYITSFYLEPEDGGFLVELLRRFPSVTALDVRAFMDQVRALVDRGALAVEFVFGFTLVAGLLVLYAAIQTSRDERLIEGGVLRALGAARRQLWLGIGLEFVTLGVLAGVVAAGFAALLGWLLADQVFGLDYRFNPWLWVAGPLGGGVGVGAAGLIGTRYVLRHPPAQVLARRAG